MLHWLIDYAETVLWSQYLHHALQIVSGWF